MTEQRPSKDQLPDSKVTPEQEARATAMASEMQMSYWGLRSAACVIVRLQDEVERLRTNAAVDERLDRVERELLEFAPPADPGPSEADHPKNDWQCAACAWMNFGSRTSCGHCEMSRAAQPPGDGQ